MTASRLESIESELRRLEGLDGELDSLNGQKGNVRARDLQRVAASLGFGPKKKKRQGEPVWIGPGGQTASIPAHSKALGVGLANKIIKGLKAAVFYQTETLLDEKNRIKKQQNQLNPWRKI